MCPRVTRFSPCLGDGGYEQKLIRDQIQTLTGRRFLGNFASDEAQYKFLMNNGATFANRFNIRPGIALTAEQMALLTSDIVWFVAEEITLENGNTKTVLVPKVYVMVKSGDLKGDGTLISARDIQLKLTGEFVNEGTFATRDTLTLSLIISAR